MVEWCPAIASARIGTNDYGVLLLGGREVFGHTQERGAALDSDTVSVALPAERTQFLFKIGDVGGPNWGFYLRIADLEGGPVSGTRWVVP